MTDEQMPDTPEEVGRIEEAKRRKDAERRRTLPTTQKKDDPMEVREMERRKRERK